MKGLLLKDLINIKSHILYYCLLLLGFSVLSLSMGNVFFFSGLVLFLSVNMTMSCMNYDEHDHWEKFAVTSGISRKKLVLEKYLFVGILLSVGFLIGIVLNILSPSFGKEGYFAVALYTCASLILLDIMLPLFFKFGVERSRFIYILCFLIVVLAVAGTGFLMGANGVALQTILYIAAGLSVVGTIVSILISIKICCLKDY